MTSSIRLDGLLAISLTTDSNDSGRSTSRPMEYLDYRIVEEVVLMQS